MQLAGQGTKPLPERADSHAQRAFQITCWQDGHPNSTQRLHNSRQPGPSCPQNRNANHAFLGKLHSGNTHHFVSFIYWKLITHFRRRIVTKVTAFYHVLVWSAHCSENGRPQAKASPMADLVTKRNLVHYVCTRHRGQQLNFKSI